MTEVVDIVGVECALCHEETFRVVEREVTTRAKVCPSCARQIDMEREDQTREEMLKGLDRQARLLALKEMSREWAHSWHGKHVTVTYDVDDGYSNIVARHCVIKGMAWFGCRHEDVGWGRVKVVLDKVEYKRITFFDYDRERFPERHIPVIDGYRWGLACQLIQHGYESELERPFALYVNWGERNRFLLEEVDKEAERLAAEREKERLRLEAEKEIARHLGEGI